MKLNEYDKGYIAGILDGEGSICLSRERPNEHRHPSITVTSTTYEILDFLYNKVGGHISRKKTYKEHHKQCWQWQIKTTLSLELLKEIKDYLLVPEKKARAELIVSEYKKVTSRNGRYSDEKLQAKLDFEKRFLEIK